MNIPMPVQQGWQCPCCRRIYSPTTMMCLYCQPSTVAPTVYGTGGAAQPYQTVICESANTDGYAVLVGAEYQPVVIRESANTDGGR